MSENPDAKGENALAPPAPSTQPVGAVTPKRRRSLLRRPSEVEQPTEEWMLSYSDMVTLLLTMFIALLLNADFTKTTRGGDRGGGGAVHGTAKGAAGVGPGRGGEHDGASDVDGSGGKVGPGSPNSGGSGQIDGPGAGQGGAGSGAAGGGMRDTLRDWFHLNVTSPYADEGGYILAMRGPAGVDSLPQDADVAVIKDQDLAQIAFRERTLSSIRQKLVDARIDQYVTAEVEGDGIRLNIPNAILFALGSAEFASEGAGVIRAIVPIIANDTYTVSVEGHTDNAPIQTEKFPSNWELSAQRAASVVRLMAEAGIGPKRLEAVGLADTQPLASNDTPEGRAQNRRVTIFLRL